MKTYTGPIPSDQELDKMLDLVKRDVFLGSNAAFLGSLLCSHNLHWDKEGNICPDTACTDGLNIWWHTNDFMRCSKEEKNATLLHELWHTGLLHFLRQGTRCPDVWNVACDYRINNNLIRDGHKLPNNGFWLFDLSLDSNGIMAEEDIYDLLMKKALPMPQKPMNDLRGSPDPSKQAEQLAAAVRAVQAAELANQAGKLPGNLREILNLFLQPKIDWRIELQRWMTELLPTSDYTWKKPNRRYPDIYLPSVEEQEGRLEHLVYFQDVSGSISKDHLTRFNSEVKFIHEQLKPKKLTLVQFDVVIQSVHEFTEDQPFENIERSGGGGTSLVPVHAWIETNKPKAAVIFSDMYCDPMQPLTTGIPIIWGVVNNRKVKPAFGKLIHVD